MAKNIISERHLSAHESLVGIFLSEIKSIILDHQGCSFVKFILLAVGIEYLGACLDPHDFNLDKRSEIRFNDALKKLFPKKYHPFSKADSPYYLFRELRCSFIHQLRPGKEIVITHKNESNREGTSHLNPIAGGRLVLVLEEFYFDFEKACRKLSELSKKKKLPSTKLNDIYIILQNVNKKV